MHRMTVVPPQDSTGTLKTTIVLGKNPSIVHSGPFYLMKEPPGLFEIYKIFFNPFNMMLLASNSCNLYSELQ